MKTDSLTFIKKNSFPAALIILGGFIFYWTRDFKEVPSGLGPAFFPRIVAAMMIGLSALYLVTKRKAAKQEEPENTGAGKQIVITVVSMLLMVAVMKYIHPIPGIVFFLAVYLKVIAGVDTVKTAVITLAGSGVLYLVIMALRIPM